MQSLAISVEQVARVCRNICGAVEMPEVQLREWQEFKTTLAKELNSKLTFSIIIICASWNLG